MPDDEEVAAAVDETGPESTASVSASEGSSATPPEASVAAGPAGASRGVGAPGDVLHSMSAPSVLAASARGRAALPPSRKPSSPSLAANSSMAPA